MCYSTSLTSELPTRRELLEELAWALLTDPRQAHAKIEELKSAFESVGKPFPGQVRNRLIEFTAARATCLSGHLLKPGPVPTKEHPEQPDYSVPGTSGDTAGDCFHVTGRADITAETFNRTPTLKELRGIKQVISTIVKGVQSKANKYKGSTVVVELSEVPWLDPAALGALLQKVGATKVYGIWHERAIELFPNAPPLSSAGNKQLSVFSSLDTVT
jgi:hypothetical protein